MAGPGLLARTTYAAGPDDKLAVVDVYTKPSAAVVNSWQDLGAQVGLDITGSLNGALKGEIGSLIKSVANGKIQLNPAAIMDRMTGGNSALSSAFRGVSSAVQGGLKIASSALNSVTATISGTVTAITGAAMNDVRGLAGVINAATSGSYGITLTDNGAMGGMVASVSLQASGLGLPKVFSTLAASINSPVVLTIAAKQLIPDAISRGDIPLLRDVVSTSVGRNVMSLYPNAVPDICYNAKDSGGLAQNQYPSYYGELKDTFSDIDPGWSTTQRGGDSVINAAGSARAASKGNDFYEDLVVSSAKSQGNSPMGDSIMAGTSAQENLTLDKTMMCVNDSVKGEPLPSVSRSLSESYPIVKTTPNSKNSVQDNTQFHSGNPAFQDSGSASFKDSGSASFKDSGSSSFKDSGSSADFSGLSAKNRNDAEYSTKAPIFDPDW